MYFVVFNFYRSLVWVSFLQYFHSHIGGRIIALYFISSQATNDVFFFLFCLNLIVSCIVFHRYSVFIGIVLEWL